MAGTFHYQNGSGNIFLIQRDSEFCQVKSHDNCETSPEWETISQYRIVFYCFYIFQLLRFKKSHNSFYEETERELDSVWFLYLLYFSNLF